MTRLRIFEDDYITVDELADYLRTQGYNGSINDMMFKYLVDQSIGSGSLPDRIPDAPASPTTGIWILATASWDDTGAWDDTDIWNDV